MAEVFEFGSVFNYYFDINGSKSDSEEDESLVENDCLTGTADNPPAFIKKFKSRFSW